MNLAEKLNQERMEKINDYAISFVEDIELEIIQSAQKGYTAYSISLDGRDDAHIIKDPIFLKNLDVLLDGCTVEITSNEYTNLFFKNKYYKYKLIISWE